MLKKINAAFSLFTSLVLLAHIGIGFQVLNGGQNPLGEVMPIVIMVCVVAHAVMSMMILCFVHDANDIKYPKMNASTVVQRVSGVLLLIPLFLSHNKIYTTEAMQTPLYGICEIAFFVLVAAHLATSLPKALVTLGALRSERAVKVASILFAVAAAALAVDGILLAVRTAF